jgi:hypothetical protein
MAAAALDADLGGVVAGHGVVLRRQAGRLGAVINGRILDADGERTAAKRLD